MNYYRLYYLHAFSGHFQQFEEFEAVSDSVALAEAKKRKGGLPLELWCERRKVGSIEAGELNLAAR